jgi:hypothetical protein
VVVQDNSSRSEIRVAHTLLLQPLSVTLGPGILGNIFDGIQRPLKQIAIESGDVFIPRGVNVAPLSIVTPWEFHPRNFKVCSVLLFPSLLPRHTSSLLTGWRPDYRGRHLWHCARELPH